MSRAWVTAVIGLLLIAGCGTPRRGVPLIGERAVEDPEIVLGRRVFDAACHQCHPGGTGGLGFAINNKPLPGWLIEFQVRQGIGAMPAFGEELITDEELDAVVAYLLWLRHLPAVTEPEERVETARTGER